MVDRLPGWPVVWPFDFRQVEFERASEATGRALQTQVRGPYLETMGFRVLRGRTFTSREQAEERDVAIVNREFARRYGLGPDPSVQRFRPVGSKAWLTIVGTVNDERHPLNGDPMPAFYRPGAERVVPYLMLRASSDVSQPVRERIWSVNADQPVLALPRMDKIVGEARAPVRFGLVLMGTFSFLALVVAALGLYAVVAYGAAARAHEIGVRMAVGATRRDIRRLVLAQAMRLAAAGAVGGLAAAAAASRVLSGVLFGVSATNPMTFCAVAAFLLLVAVGAAWHPAHQATRADPMAALRVE